MLEFHVMLKYDEKTWIFWKFLEMLRKIDGKSRMDILNIKLFFSGKVKRPYTIYTKASIEACFILLSLSPVISSSEN